MIVSEEPKYAKGDYVNLRGYGIVKVLHIRRSGVDNTPMYTVGFGAAKLHPREYSEYNLNHKVTKQDAKEFARMIRERLEKI